VARVTWWIAGSYFEACNCEAICPCRSIGGRPGGRSTYGICQFALSWHIVEGRAASVGLDDLDVVMAGFYEDDEPGSPWSVVLYLDDRASDPQADWLARIFLGRAGGDTEANFAAAIGTVHAVRRAGIQRSHEPDAWAVGVEGHVTIASSERVPSHEPVACGIPGLDRPGQELRASALRVHDAPLAWDMTGRCAFATDFAYASRMAT
jgi:hypothetical protein